MYKLFVQVVGISLLITACASASDFARGEVDSFAGTISMQARHLDPEAGIFLSKDPLGAGAELNSYSYCNANPVNHVDPSGHALETVWDVANVGWGAYSLYDNINNGNWGWAAVDGVGLLYDGFATAVPFLPAGAAAGLRAARAGTNAALKAASKTDSLKSVVEVKCCRSIQRYGQSGHDD